MSSLRKLFQSRRKLFWAAAVAVVAADQLSKVLLWQHPDGGRAPIVLIPKLLRIISHEGNTRAVFGQGPASPAFYIGAALVGLGLIGIFFWTTDAGKGLVHVALGMLAGGAVGNLIDRATLQRVRDFIDLHWGAHHWPTFNLADAAICTGFALVVYDCFFARPALAEQQEGEPADV